MKLDLNQIKNKVLPILKEAGVIRSSLFGSYVRGEKKQLAGFKAYIEHN